MISLTDIEKNLGKSTTKQKAKTGYIFKLELSAEVHDVPEDVSNGNNTHVVVILTYGGCQFFPGKVTILRLTKLEV